MPSDTVIPGSLVSVDWSQSVGHHYLVKGQHVDALRFDNRPGIALIIGGTGGLGSPVVRTLADRGAKVVLTYRSNQDAADSLVSDITSTGGEVSACPLDLHDHSSITSVVNGAIADGGGLHSLVYAAGPHVNLDYLSQTDPSAMASHLHADAAAFFALVHAALPALREAGSGKTDKSMSGAGAIAAVTTAATNRFSPRDVVSSAPKAAVEAICRAVAVEEGRNGVRANMVGPGMMTDGMAERLIASGHINDQTQTQMRRNIPMRTFGSGQDIAETVAFLLSDAARYITGQKINCDGGYTI